MTNLKVFPGDPDQNHFAVEVSPDKSEAIVRLIVEGKGAWMTFSPSQLDNVIKVLTEARSGIREMTH